MTGCISIVFFNLKKIEPYDHYAACCVPLNSNNNHPVVHKVEHACQACQHFTRLSKNFAFGTQRNLYSTDSRCGFALGDNANFKIRIGGDAI